MSFNNIFIHFNLNQKILETPQIFDKMFVLLQKFKFCSVHRCTLLIFTSFGNWIILLKPKLLQLVSSVHKFDPLLKKRVFTRAVFELVWS